jgi:serine/threonine protein phosphatase PrpC
VKAACKIMVDKANEAGGTDNVTLSLIELLDD